MQGVQGTVSKTGQEQSHGWLSGSWGAGCRIGSGACGRLRTTEFKEPQRERAGTQVTCCIAGSHLRRS